MLLRKTKKFRAVPSPAPSVLNERQAPVRPKGEAFGVFQTRTVGELAPFLDLGQNSLPPTLPV